MVVGLYVGFATVGIFAYWFVFYDWAEYAHPLVTFEQLRNWGKCANYDEMGIGPYKPDFTKWSESGYGMDLSAAPCEYFTKGKTTASTLSLSVLVVIEMLNALNALSEDGSLLQMPPWANPYLLLAMVVSIGLHIVILYVPVCAAIFSIVPLTYNDWVLVMIFSSPVILIDEILKMFGRAYQRKELAARLKAEKSQ
jgi:Ca2+-transporting ATPase